MGAGHDVRNGVLGIHRHRHRLHHRLLRAVLHIQINHPVRNNNRSLRRRDVLVPLFLPQQTVSNLLCTTQYLSLISTVFSSFFSSTFLQKNPKNMN